MTMDSSNVIYVAALGFTGLIGAYVLYGPSNSKKKKKKGHIPGLQNFGNSCFLNAVLQSVAACDLLRKSLKKYSDENIEGKYDFLLSVATLRILRELNCEDKNLCAAYSAMYVIEALRRHGWVISRDEQDAHELFQILISTIDEELSKKLSCCSLLDIKSMQSGTKVSTYDSPFQGLFANQMKCQVCSKKFPIHFDCFNSLSLAIPERSNPSVSLYDCLQHFMSSELVHNIDCENCAKISATGSSTKSTFIKDLAIGKLPGCICIHFQRTIWTNSGVPIKCRKQVYFPEYLYMGQYLYYKSSHYNCSKYVNTMLKGGKSPLDIKNVDPNSKPVSINNPNYSSHLDSFRSINYAPPIYRLVAVIVHHGDVYSGHYITYRLGWSSESHEKHLWFYTSDSDVRKVTLREVLQANAYMLMYERTSSKCVDAATFDKGSDIDAKIR